MTKKIIMSLTFLALAGCFGPSNYFMLTGPTHIEAYQTKRLPTIGVEQITIPEYMQQGKIAVQLSPTQINYSDSSVWAEEMDASLTKQLISVIQKSFNHPNVYAYPWDLSQQAGVKIKVSISKFIAYGDNVYLDANWEILDLKRGRRYSRLFSTKVPSGKDTASVVASMNAAFEELSESIVREIARKF
ncbi:MAG: PqiC family protein [Campylobacterota bacterium]|nr:PqiC family protein [Campylobacterota bacterium]